MANPFLFADTVQKIGDTILRLADARNDPLCLRDLQALACVNRKCRQMFSGYPHLVTARRVFAGCETGPHEKSPFDKMQNPIRRHCPYRNNRDNVVDADTCKCHRGRSTGCRCACHEQCSLCGEHRFFRTCTVANNVIRHGQCANFQRFKYALYTLGNVPVALCFLAMGQVYMPIKDVLDEELLVRNGHLDAIKLLVDGGMAKLPIDFDQYGPMGTAAFYDVNHGRLEKAIAFIRSAARYKETQPGYAESSTRHVLVTAKQTWVGPEKLDVFIKYFPAMFSDDESLRELARLALKEAYRKFAKRDISTDPNAATEALLEWIAERADRVGHLASDSLDIIVSAALSLTRAWKSDDANDRVVDAAFLVFVFKWVKSQTTMRTTRTSQERWDAWKNNEDFVSSVGGILDNADPMRADDHVRNERLRKRSRQIYYKSDKIKPADHDQYVRDLADQRALLKFMKFIGKYFYKRPKK